MKIGIDASLVVGEKAGVGWATANLIEALATVDQKNQYSLYPFFYYIFDPHRYQSSSREALCIYRGFFREPVRDDVNGRALRRRALHRRFHVSQDRGRKLKQFDIQLLSSRGCGPLQIHGGLVGAYPRQQCAWPHVFLLQMRKNHHKSRCLAQFFRLDPQESP